MVYTWYDPDKVLKIDEDTFLNLWDLLTVKVDEEKGTAVFTFFYNTHEFPLNSPEYRAFERWATTRKNTFIR